MDYEKKYKEALAAIQELYNSMKYMSSTDALHTTTTLEKAFPELKESEDERIKKVVTLIIKGIRANVFEYKGISKEDVITWLEKQGEQNPTWSKEDEEILEDIRFNYEFNKSGMTEGLIEQYNKWFEKIKSLKPQPQWKPSEEQIQALEYQVHSTYEGSWQYKASKELLEQLKKL